MTSRSKHPLAVKHEIGPQYKARHDQKNETSTVMIHSMYRGTVTTTGYDEQSSKGGDVAPGTTLTNPPQ